MRGLAKRLAYIWIFLISGCMILSGDSSYSATPLPDSPPSYILDEPQVLNSATRTSIGNLLAAHDRKTGEQVVIAIFATLGSEDLVSWTNQVFKYWKVGQKGKDNGVLLALYWKEHQSRIEVGYGLEGLLTDARAKRILVESLIPELKQGHPDQALIAGTVALLTTLQSPLIQSGEAAAILKMGGPALPSVVPRRVPLNWLIWGIPVFTVMLILYNLFFVGGGGLFRRNSGGLIGRRRRSWWDDWGGPGTGSGGFGGGGSTSGGGGGFGGGGGSSGGGGANEGW